MWCLKHDFFSEEMQSYPSPVKIIVTSIYFEVDVGEQNTKCGNPV